MFSPGSAETDNKISGKINGHLMVSCVRKYLRFFSGHGVFLLGSTFYWNRVWHRNVTLIGNTNTSSEMTQFFIETKVLGKTALIMIKN